MAYPNRWLNFGRLLLLVLVPVTVAASEQSCNPANCRLPHCFCMGKTAPGGLKPSNIPQIVMLSFDDWLNTERYEYFKRLFPVTRTNPNGCPITVTFFVSEDGGTNYTLVNEVYNRGHHVCSHSISHRFPEKWWSETATYKDYTDEIIGQKNKLVQEGGLPGAAVNCMRTPFLHVGGDNQFKMMQDNYFKFDSSFSVLGADSKNNYWPFTLDYGVPKETCQVGTCPKDVYPGVWEVPLIQLKQENYCELLDFCHVTTKNEDRVYDYLYSNFKRYYYGNKAPFGLHLHASWFKRTPVNIEALERFILFLTSLPDVYIVNMNDMLTWIQHPGGLDKIDRFIPWLKNRGCLKYRRRKNRPLQKTERRTRKQYNSK